MSPFYTDKQITDMFLLLTDKLPPPHKFFPKPPLPDLNKFPKETRNNKQKNDAEKFSVFFLVEQIINLSNQFTNYFARVIDFSYEISAL